ncbi:hypothetical protein RG47T_2945 [Mucilaginibacter polytrichastri]|uniref:Uncharacterized protein n=1 Tax=Mucilaginibacter polytrichastri TaxID=1302689 RepID=A0A1Q6A0D4_9SPHI|nr:hypothetical protein RG47T_2945 [Mucilaginibacter polytrichastri]
MAKGNKVNSEKNSPAIRLQLSMNTQLKAENKFTFYKYD